MKIHSGQLSWNTTLNTCVWANEKKKEKKKTKKIQEREIPIWFTTLDLQN